ncbi:MAG: Gfo/Idh/MocA family protein [Longimicrobiales bacterium]
MGAAPVEAETEPLGVAVVGCGLIGWRRAEAAWRNERTRLAMAVDIALPAARGVAAEFGGDAAGEWRAVLERDDVSIVVVATPNAYLAEIGVAMLESGRHVLVEKPPGRTLEEAQRLADAARAAARLCKIGFNHRYHPAIRAARARFEAGDIGRLIHLRARYGHGARPGCEAEWRADAELAGGGELLDQGVHLADLFRWFAGDARWAVATLQTAVWPIAPLEDNAFGLLRFSDGVVGQLHVSMTQWANLFSFEVGGERGTLVIEGLGGSYGTERLAHIKRRLEGGVPDLDERYYRGDPSWSLEFDDLVDAVVQGRRVDGDAEDGVGAMRMIDALYRSAATGTPVEPVERC